MLVGRVQNKWHHFYPKWLYIPLGGKNCKIVNNYLYPKVKYKCPIRLNKTFFSKELFLFEENKFFYLSRSDEWETVRDQAYFQVEGYEMKKQGKKKNSSYFWETE